MLVQNRYGKARVRVARVVRGRDRHELHEMTAGIVLEGDFAAAYRDGDNRAVLPTDTMKNTVYALAQDPAVAHPETFGLLLGRHFVAGPAPVSRARIHIRSRAWRRHDEFSFVGGDSYHRVARIEVTRESETVEAGVTGYDLLKTTGSGFEGFLRDRYTTLKDASDRILATSLSALWRYGVSDVSWDASWHAVMKLLVETFAEHRSKSVQHTLYAMGEAVLAECEQVAEIRLRMPNRHYLPVEGDVYCPTSEPYGLIEAVLAR